MICTYSTGVESISALPPNSAARPECRRRVTRARLRSTLLVLVPCLALAAWFVVAPSDRMTPPPDDHFLPALVYDEFDLSAMALRGLNAELGRRAGATANPDMINRAYFHRYLSWDIEPEPRYFLEYPHAILVLFRAGYWIQTDWRDAQFPKALPDCDYHNIASIVPETEHEFRWLQPIVTATHFYVVVMFVALIGLIATMEWGYGPGTGLRGGALLLLLPATLFFSLNRFDVLPALFTALAFAALGRRRELPAAILFGMATLIKVYPILFVPLILRYLWPNRREASRFLAAYVATGLLGFSPLLFGDDWQAVFAPYRFQLTRPPEVGMILYGCCLPLKLAFGNLGLAFRLASLAATIAIMLATPIRDLSSLVRRCAIVLLVFVSLAVFYSPQWLLWFVPLLPPLVGQNRRLGWGMAALDAITYLTFPLWFWILPTYTDDCMTKLEPLLLANSLGAASQCSHFLMNECGNFLRLSRGVCCLAIAISLARMEWSWPDWLPRVNLLPARSGRFLRRASDQP